jgi:hypothetical protein
MKTLCPSAPSRCTTLLATFTVILTATCVLVPRAGAQTTPYALLQNSALNGAGNTITATYLPVVTSTGTLYFDLTVQFSVASNGTLTVSSVQQAKAPTPINNSFVPGIYLGPDDGIEFITVTGPGVTEGGNTGWAINPGPNSGDCLYPSSATWYDVGMAIANNPLYVQRLKPAGITSSQFYQYGTGASNCGGADWSTNSLLGFEQVGTSLVVASFTSNNKDQSTPVDTRTFCLVGSPDCGTN